MCTPWRDSVYVATPLSEIEKLRIQFDKKITEMEEEMEKKPEITFNLKSSLHNKKNRPLNKN